MNGKRYKRRAPKITQKSDRGNQHRRVLEGKSNIGAKRITLLPGFLINGFTSNTAKKARDVEDSRQKKNHLLNEDLQAFLEQKGRHPRRSQRIQNKHLSQLSPNRFKAILNNNSTPVTNVSQNNSSNNNFKSILKNSSKSIFKEISERFSKVNLHHSEVASQKVNPRIEYEQIHENYGHLNQTSDHVNENGNFSIEVQENHNNEISEPNQNDVFQINMNRSFCKDLGNRISVTFKRRAVDDSRETIRKERQVVNMVLEGRIQLEDKVVTDCNESDSNEASNGPLTKFHPIPQQNWVYKTPPKQKIGVPRLEQSHLQAGILCQKKNHQNLYEVKPNFNGELFGMKHFEQVSIEDKFLRKVAEVRKTPAPVSFGLRMCGGEDRERSFQQTWVDGGGICNGVEEGHMKDSFVNPNFVNIISRPTKTNTRSMFTDFSQNKIPTPFPQNTTTPQNVEQLQDFTFIEEGNQFKIKESQNAPQQRNKRKLSEEVFVMKRRNGFNAEVSCDTDKMFNFGSQERNMFDFGKVA